MLKLMETLFFKLLCMTPGTDYAVLKSSLLDKESDTGSGRHLWLKYFVILDSV